MALSNYQLMLFATVCNIVPAMDGARIHPRKSAGGFTLIEIAIGLFIIGLVISGLVTFLNAMVANRQIEVTKVKQEAIKTALISFISRNGRLPCPAVGALADGAANEGIEALNPGTCTDTVVAGTAPNRMTTGVVPWVTLGITKDTSLDAYFHRFTYAVVLTTTALTVSLPGLTGRISIHRTTPTTAANQLNNCSGGLSVNPCAAVAVIVSHGKDGYGAYQGNGTQMPYDSTITGNDSRENSNNDHYFVVKDASNIESNPYDDIVMPLTASDLLGPLVTAGSIKDTRAVLNATFEILKGAITADAFNNGGLFSGERTYVLQTSLPSSLSAAQKADPWGNQIVYQKDPGQTNINCGDSPSQLAYTLTSRGPDSIAGTSDDISIPVYSAEIISVISTVGCNR